MIKKITTVSILAQNETDKIGKSLEAYTTKKMDNIKKNDFTVPSNKNLENEKSTIEEKKSSQSYDMESVKFVDCINFNNGDFEDKVLNYMEKLIYSNITYCIKVYRFIFLS